MRRYAITKLIGNRFKEELEAFKKKKKLSYRELSELSQFPEYTIFRWLRKENTPSIETVKLVCARLEMDTEKILHGQPSKQNRYVVSDWDLFDGICDSYTRVMGEKRPEVGEELLQDVAVRLYRYMRNYNYPVILQCNGQTPTEHHSILFMLAHPNSSVKNHQITVYGGMEDRVYVNLDRLVPERHSDKTIKSDGYNLTSGKFTKGWLKHATEYIGKQLEQRQKEIEGLIVQNEQFEKEAENLSVI